MQRSIHAFHPITGAELAVITVTVQPNLNQLSDDEMVKASRQDFVQLHSLSQSDADTARYEVRED